MNCLTWFEAFAFCIWDGGRLPTAAELNLAHRGGLEMRKYPWGAAALDSTRAFYCEADSGVCATTLLANFPAVGSRTNGAGRWGQLDLVGSLREYVLDFRTPIPDPCTDCAQLDSAQTSARGNWGYSWADSPSSIDTNGLTTSTSARTSAGGFRCARDL
jgi:formylglycine-generating enzyme required for sulfatase activity